MTESRSGSGRRGSRATVALATAVAGLSLGAGGALASGGGGISVPDPPHLRDVTCKNTCGGPHKATTGSVVEGVGRHLRRVRHVLFDAQNGADIAVAPKSVTRRHVTATVPDGAVTGKPKVVDRYQNADSSPHELKIVDPSQIPDTFFKLRKAVAGAGRVFYDGKHAAKLRYLFSADGPTDVRILVVHRSNGKLVDRMIRREQSPGDIHTVKWRGRARDPQGGYRFKVRPVGGKADSTDQAKFAYHGWKFPVRGRHSYGDGYGAPRVGHIHMGQDVAASCGTPLEAARGGRVQYKAYQASGAGYYVVIDGKRDNHDYVYMHLRRPASVRAGHHVRTGERIGRVGETGDATGCHLHFEYWRDDWYNGGKALSSVDRVIRRWDRWS